MNDGERLRLKRRRHTGQLKMRSREVCIRRRKEERLRQMSRRNDQAAEFRCMGGVYSVALNDEAPGRASLVWRARQDLNL